MIDAVTAHCAAIRGKLLRLSDWKGLQSFLALGLQRTTVSHNHKYAELEEIG